VTPARLSTGGRPATGLALLLALAAGFAGLARPASGRAASPGAPAPALQAKAAIAVEASTGDVVYARHPDQERAIASTTKLMTALLALERVSLHDTFTAPAYAAGPSESRLGLRAGERMRVADLMRAMLLPSANDAALTVADGVAGSRSAFVRAMNAKARQIGLKHSHFSTPVGLDQAGNYSTARDLATLVLRLRRNTFFRRTVDQPRAVLHTGDHVRVVTNRNPLVISTPWVNGVKTGHTLDAGYVLVGSGTRAGVTVVSVVLGDSSEAARASDTLKLLRWAIGRYRRAQVLRAGQVLARPHVRYRDEHVDLVPARPVTLTVRRGLPVPVRVEAPAEVDGPLRRGQQVGTATVRYRGRTVARVPLVAARAVPGAGFGRRLVDALTKPLTLVLLAAIVASAIPLALMRRRTMQRRRGRARTRTREAA
jgi:serine-type D-Ala-D-Ala carboxypeptidase (penicillin-binding protein 5/6)